MDDLFGNEALGKLRLCGNSAGLAGRVHANAYVRSVPAGRRVIALLRRWHAPVREPTFSDKTYVPHPVGVYVLYALLKRNPHNSQP
jgi:hypothetical protein